jgi:chemotaxis protein methyltransferase CheR
MPLTTTHQEQLKSLTEENFRFLCQTVYHESGIVLDDSKGYLVEARLVPVAKDEGAASLDGLCNLIRAIGGSRIRDKVVEAMTTNETLFFRDLAPFEALENVVISEMLAKQKGSRNLRIWSAASSSGQEPYSLAMMWLEMGNAARELEILGTDLSEEILDKAKAGRYMQLEVNRGLPAKYLVKHFTRQNLEWEISSSIRNMVSWKKFNLKSNASMLGTFDIVLCRNVLIYFDVETKQKILKNIRKTLAPGGYLILGSSETTLNIDDSFERRQIGRAILYQNPPA